MPARKTRNTGTMSRQQRRRKRERVVKDRWRKDHLKVLRIRRTAESAADD